MSEKELKELDDPKGSDLDDKLLPCPFCGENPEIEYGSTRDFIQCCNNMCPAHSPITYVKLEDDRKKAYKKWNTRAPSKQLTATQQALEALKASQQAITRLSLTTDEYPTVSEWKALLRQIEAALASISKE